MNGLRDSYLARAYAATVLRYPVITLALFTLLAIASLYSAREFRLDASADALTLENDRSLKYFREVVKRYSANDFLVIAYTPRSGDLFSSRTLVDLAELRAKLTPLDGVDSVISMLDVPLLRSPPVPLTELADNLRTLESPDVDLALAREELKSSPLYRNLLVSPNRPTTAILINLRLDTEYRRLLNARDDLRQLSRERELTAQEAQALAEATEAFRLYKIEAAQRQHELITTIRTIMDEHRADAELFLGGASMIADDLITFVRNDIAVFGIGILAFMVLTLAVIFRHVRWVLLPLLTCGITILLMVGLLGLFKWPVTVISSNFISLLLIITLSITIHVTVRYRQRLAQQPDASQRDLVLYAVATMARPCIYTAVTTMVGFFSLIVSDIRPVIDFGYMMTLGVAVALIVVFMVFPAVLVLLPVDQRTADPNPERAFTGYFARISDHHRAAVITISGLLLVATVWGISRLEVENSFINYFRQSTEIYQGMKLIDEQLGGTTPLDVIYRFPEEPAPPIPAEPPADGADEFDDFDAMFAEGASSGPDPAVWFTRRKMARIREIHEFLDTLPTTGKVLSMDTMMRIAESFNDGKPLDNLALQLLYKRVPDDLRSLVIEPYVDIERNEARFTLRVIDSDPDLRRSALLEQIRAGLVEEVGLAPDSVRLTGLLVLYNNMLQSLYRSQILTIGVVFAGIMAMFLVLFRSLPLALIAITPNLLAAGTVLGLMGWVGIPLDLMTITIAAITIGIAVDDTIHFITRFREEFPQIGNYRDTMYLCHRTIGKAMFYTSLVIVVGFSILVTSNFIPSIIFGLLTALAMVIALIAALTLLPVLIVWFKPLGPEQTPTQTETASA